MSSEKTNSERVVLYEPTNIVEALGMALHILEQAPKFNTDFVRVDDIGFFPVTSKEVILKIKKVWNERYLKND